MNKLLIILFILLQITSPPRRSPGNPTSGEYWDSDSTYFHNIYGDWPHSTDGLYYYQENGNIYLTTKQWYRDRWGRWQRTTKATDSFIERLWRNNGGSPDDTPLHPKNPVPLETDGESIRYVICLLILFSLVKYGITIKQHRKS